MINLPDPRSPLSRQEQLVLGVDACRHPLLGVPIGHGNGDPGQQARDYLIARRQATEQDTFPRDKSLDLTEAEFRGLWRKLETWEKSNSVLMPPRAVSIDHPERRK